MKNFFLGLETAIIGMATLRIISGLIELSAAGLMLRFNQIEKAITINALLAIVGPLVLITTMTIGLVGLADKLSLTKLLLIGLGVALILIGVKSK